MAVLFDSGIAPARDSDDQLSALFADAGTAIDVSHVREGQRTVIEHWSVGSHDLFLAVGDGLRLTRTAARLQQDPNESLRLGYLHRGRYTMTGSDHAESGRHGRLIVTDLTRPCVFTQLGSGATAASFEITYQQLGANPTDVRVALTQLASSPIYRLLQGHLARLCDTMRATDVADVRPLVADATLQLARAMILSTVNMPRRADVLNDVLYARIVEFVVQHLSDPGLLPAEIAAVHGISLRQLYRLWTRNDVGVAEWIMSERLSGAAHDLRDPAMAYRSISATARAWGFSDAAHFSRRFRDYFGLSPTDWQHAHANMPNGDR